MSPPAVVLSGNLRGCEEHISWMPWALTYKKNSEVSLGMLLWSFASVLYNGTGLSWFLLVAKCSTVFVHSIVGACELAILLWISVILLRLIASFTSSFHLFLILFAFRYGFRSSFSIRVWVWIVGQCG